MYTCCDALGHSKNPHTRNLNYFLPPEEWSSMAQGSRRFPAEFQTLLVTEPDKEGISLWPKQAAFARPISIDKEFK